MLDSQALHTQDIPFGQEMVYTKRSTGNTQKMKAKTSDLLATFFQVLHIYKLA